MRKSVAIGIAGVTAVVVAAWRQVQRDNTISTEPASTGGASRPSAPKTNPATSAASAQPQALFTPSVGEKSTKAELYEFATELGIEGRSKMNKSELLEAIRSAS